MADEDFGGDDLEAAPTAQNVIPFPVRSSAKLGEVWDRELASANRRLERSYRFVSPISALADLMRKRKLPCMPWPEQWPELAKRARLYVGEMAAVTGPEGGGKTSFALQVAIACRAQGIPSLWNALELDAAEVDLRLVANMTGTHTSRIRDEWSEAQLANVLANVDDLWRYVPRERDLDRQIDAYRAAIRIAKSVYGRPPLLVIDYLGKLARGARDPRLATADAVERLRELTLEEECFTIVLSQTSRSNKGMLTGKVEIEAATDAAGVSAESGELEGAVAVNIALNVFKQDDAEELDAHVLVSKARGTGREGRQGFRFRKPGGVWAELDYLPSTPSEIAAKNKKDRKDKNRVEPPTKETTRDELNAERASTADGERRRRIIGALARAGFDGLGTAELRKVPGAGRAQRLQQSLQELERAGDIERNLTTKKWRLIRR